MVQFTLRGKRIILQSPYEDEHRLLNMNSHPDSNGTDSRNSSVPQAASSIQVWNPFKSVLTSCLNLACSLGTSVVSNANTTPTRRSLVLFNKMKTDDPWNNTNTAGITPQSSSSSSPSSSSSSGFRDSTERTVGVRMQDTPMSSTLSLPETSTAIITTEGARGGGAGEGGGGRGGAIYSAVNQSKARKEGYSGGGAFTAPTNCSYSPDNSKHEYQPQIPHPPPPPPPPSATQYATGPTGKELGSGSKRRTHMGEGDSNTAPSAPQTKSSQRADHEKIYYSS